MNMKAVIASSLFIMLYAALIVPMSLALVPFSWIGLVAVSCYSIMALTIAANVSEQVLANFWSARPVSAVEGITPREKVAVLMTVCDDQNEACLAELRPLFEAGYAVFILDDSVLPGGGHFPAGIPIVRRNSRSGAKAGNLNNWLRVNGARFEYLIILDADSIMPLETVDALVMAAEHSANAGTAIFQAKIQPRANSASLLAAGVAAGARPRNRVLERVHAPLGLLLSGGHNVLLRCAAIRSVGGFDEDLTNEDTVISIELISSGWRTVLVDAWSSDEEPSTFSSLTRRSTRWARQTVELLNRDWCSAPLRIRLLLCRHIMAYVFLPLATLLLAMSVWTAPTEPLAVMRYMFSVLTFGSGVSMLSIATWSMIGVASIWFGVRASLSAFERVPWSAQVAAAAVMGAAHVVMVLPVTLGMIASLLGRRVSFTPTGSRRGNHERKAIWDQCVASLVVVFGVVITGVALHPGSLALGLNFVWIAGVASAPAVVMLCGDSERRPP